jgi:hypothetical protein
MNLPQPASDAPCCVAIVAAAGGSGLRFLAQHAGHLHARPPTA